MRRVNRNNEKVELLVYLRAIPLLLMNPVILLAPLLASILDQVLRLSIPSGFTGLLVFLLDTFAVAVAVIVADQIWRRGKASFDEAWDDSKRKAGDILFAGLGLNFITYIATYAGSIFSPLLAVILGIVAYVFLVHTVSAAALSGVPGALALQKSIDTVKAAPINAVILTAVSLAAYFFIGIYLPGTYLSDYGTMSLVAVAACKSIALAYIALILAERFNALNFSSRY